MSTRRCATPAPTSGAGPTTKRMRLGHTGRAASRCRAEGERRSRRVGTRSRPATALMVPQETHQCNENLARCRVAIDTWSARPASWRRCWRSRAGSGAAFRRSAAWGCAVTSAPPVDRDRLVESPAELRAELAEATAARDPSYFPRLAAVQTSARPISSSRPDAGAEPGTWGRGGCFSNPDPPTLWTRLENDHHDPAIGLFGREASA